LEQRECSLCFNFTKSSHADLVWFRSWVSRTEPVIKEALGDIARLFFIYDEYEKGYDKIQKMRVFKRTQKFKRLEKRMGKMEKFQQVLEGFLGIFEDLTQSDEVWTFITGRIPGIDVKMKTLRDKVRAGDADFNNDKIVTDVEKEALKFFQKAQKIWTYTKYIALILYGAANIYLLIWH
jgi:hypothetical protein